MKLLYILLATTLSIQLLASREGNGGDAIVCQSEDKKTRTVELLDYYQAFDRGYIQNLDLPPDNASFDHKVREALNRLSKFDSFRAQRYLKWYEDFFSEKNFSWKEKLGPIDDSGSSSYKQNCRQLQLAIQEKPLFPQDKRYKIAKPLWDLMSENHKAGLILHELIYRDALEIREHFLSIKSKPAIFVHPDSRKVRFFNAIISSKAFNTYTEKDYHELVIATDLLYASKDGFAFPIQSVNWFEKRLVPEDRHYFEDTKTLKTIISFSEDSLTDFLYGQTYTSIDGHRIFTGKHYTDLMFDKNSKIDGHLRFGYQKNNEIKLSPVVSIEPYGHDWMYSRIRIKDSRITLKQNYFFGGIKINTEILKATVSVKQKHGGFHFTFGENYMRPSFKDDLAIQNSMFPVFEYNGKSYDFRFSDLRTNEYPYMTNLYFDPKNEEPRLCLATEKKNQGKTYKYLAYCGYLKDIIRLEASDFDAKKTFSSNNFKRNSARCSKYLKTKNFNMLFKCEADYKTCSTKRKKYCSHRIVGRKEL
ncbi:MAG: hypothetical protein VX642_14385 [Bdellovibrionota bacterium]|nr:hypothetical protein [Bdellovibrionota bacterium]